MTQRLQIAVLIDGDNLAPDFVVRLLREAEKLGDLRLKRVYRDWSQISTDWNALIQKESLRPARRNACTVRKNASDIALVVDAMDLLFKGVKAFCLFSSDSDFTPLAKRLRKDGAEVYGFGEEKTPEALRVACNAFIVLPPDLRHVQTIAKRQLVKVMRKLAANGDAVPLSVIGHEMTVNYGFSSLKKLIEATDAVSLEGTTHAKLIKAA